MYPPRDNQDDCMINKLMTLYKSVMSMAKSTFEIMLIVVISLIMIELLSKFVYVAYKYKYPNYRYYDNSWPGFEPREYEKEILSTTLVWNSYVYWRHKSFSGKFINIDDNGIRKTWNNPAATKEKLLRIFMFGGSTMWGSGARDDFTIPSFVSKVISKDLDMQVNITNFGQSGYVSTQEILTLQNELKSGNIPDAVIFYDGFNDVFSAYQNNKAGLPQNEFNRKMEFNAFRSENRRRLYKNYLATLVTYSKTFFLIDHLLGKLNSNSNTLSANKNIDSEKLSDEIVKTYASNIRLVNALSKEYGFKTFYFWQPVIFMNKPLTDGEKILARKMDFCKELYVKSYGKIDTNFYKVNNFYNISDVFSNDTKSYYLDSCHLKESGNELVARKIVDIIKSNIAKD